MESPLPADWGNGFNHPLHWKFVSDLPPEAAVAARLNPDERITSAWEATHQCGPATRAIPGFPEHIEGYLVLTTRRLVFVQETGSRFSKRYGLVSALDWPLTSLGGVTPHLGQGGHDGPSGFFVQGEYFSVGKGNSRENGRALWLIERGRTTSQATRSPITQHSPPVPEPTPTESSPRNPVQPSRLADDPVPSPAIAPPSPSTEGKPEARQPTGQGLSRPGLPAWPMVPMTIVEAPDPDAFWRIVGSSGVDRSKLLIVCTESPAEISAAYGLAGATLWRLTRTEGERKVSPADADKLGYILSEHLGRESGQAIVLKGIDRVIEEASFRTTLNLLDILRETAERTRGAVLVYADPVVIGSKELHQIEDGVKVLRL